METGLKPSCWLAGFNTGKIREIGLKDIILYGLEIKSYIQSSKIRYVDNTPLHPLPASRLSRGEVEVSK
jgi:hypothetical protein